MIGPFDFPQELADNNWELIELMLTAGVFDGLPDKGDALTTRGELRGWADG